MNIFSDLKKPSVAIIENWVLTLQLFLLRPKVGSGLPLWLPKGTIIRESLIEFLRDEQRKRGYQALIAPHIANLDLYKTSGPLSVLQRLAITADQIGKQRSIFIEADQLFPPPSNLFI